MKGTLFDIQHYAVHDGTGIRTLVFFKGCPLTCQWCCNPESQSRRPELRYVALRCQAHKECLAACPFGAISADREGLHVDRSNCPDCKSWPCVEACPESALVRIGTEMTAEAVLEQVAKDKDFYRNSGGGITFSGGEPFAQAAFLQALLEGCRDRGISTVVETCGFARNEDIVTAEPLVDFFLFDLKVMDPERSAALTGQDNKPILENLAMLAGRCPERVIVRVPIIPGATDDTSNLEAIARFMAEHELKLVHLEPYHTLGAEKYSGLGRTYGCDADPRSLTRERMQELGSIFEGKGVRWEVP